MADPGRPFDPDDPDGRFHVARAARQRRLHARMLKAYGPAAPAARRAHTDLRQTLAATGSLDAQIALLRSTDPLPLDGEPAPTADRGR